MKHAIGPFTRTVQCLTLLCLAIGSVSGPKSVVATQDRSDFRSLLGRFSVDLPPKCSDFRFTFLKIAQYSFPVKIYTWQSANDVFTITVGEGVNDLEYPEFV